MSYLREAQRDVELFHRATGQGVADKPTMPDEPTRKLRASLIAEEVAETISALGFDVAISVIVPPPDGELRSMEDQRVVSITKLADLNLAEVADGIADSIYVELGTAAAAGVDMEPVWEAVQRANISKVSGPKRPDGKQLKPEGWQPPDVEGILRAQAGGNSCSFGSCCDDRRPLGVSEGCDGPMLVEFHTDGCIGARGPA